MLGYIDDAYNEPFFIAAIERLHPALRGTYRPIRIDQRAVWADGVQALATEERTARTAETIQQHLLSWDLADKVGKVLPVSTELIRKLRPALYDRLFSVVFGYSASDPDPQAPKEQQAALAADKFPRG